MILPADKYLGLFSSPHTLANDLEAQGWRVWLKTLAPDSCTSPFSEEQAEFWELYWGVLQKQKNGEPVSNAEKNIVLPLARGNGKCLEASTEIALADGTITTIQNIKVGDRIVSYNELFGSMEIDTISRKWESGIKPCLRLGTFMGKSLTLSGDHQVLTINGWKRAADLTLNDRIASPRTLPVFHIDNTHADEEVRLLAYFLAEGNTTGNYGGNTCFAANITNADAPIVDDAIACARSMGFKGQRRQRYRVSFTDGIRPWIRAMGMAYKKAVEKRLPIWVFQLPERQKWQFLSAFLDTDGWISQKIGVTLASKGMIEDLQRLCLQVGVISNIRFRKNDCSNAWELTLDSRCIKEHAHKLSLRVKHDKLVRWCEKRRYSLADTYPYQELRGLPYGVGYSVQKAGLSISNTYDVTREKVASAIEIYPHYRWQRLESNEVFWDKVASIEDVGECLTYDVEVARNHNLITNSLVSHNSTVAELAVIAEGCILNAGFALYLSDSQLLAEEHLYSVKSILENGIFAKYYPQMARPKVSQTGNQAKFTQDTIVTENGWGMTARGITGNVRGGRLGTLRFTLIVVDDADSLTDSLAVIEKKKRILSRSVYPAMDKRLGKTIFAQNLITENSVASQIVYRKTDILSERTIIGEQSGHKRGVPAFRELSLDAVTQPDGNVRWEIAHAVPTWEYFNVQDAQNFLSLSGKEAFLAEYQHEFTSRSGKVIPNYDESSQVISWSEFEKVFGTRYIPPHWRSVCSVDIGYSDGMHPHYSAWSFIAVASMNSKMPNAHFVYRSKTYKGTAIEDQAIDVWKSLLPNETRSHAEYSVNFEQYPALTQHFPASSGTEVGGQIKQWQMSHEKTGEMLTLRMRYGLPFMKFAHYKATDGVPQWNHLSMCDYTQPNPFKDDEKGDDGQWFIGRPQIFYIVDDDQLLMPRDDRGMKLLREQVSTWEWVPTKITDTGLTEEKPSKVGDDCPDSIKAAVYWLHATTATPLTEAEKLVERMPESVRDNDKLDEQQRQARNLWLQREAKEDVRRKANEPDTRGTTHIMDWMDRNI